VPRVSPESTFLRNRINPFLGPPPFLISDRMNCTVMRYTKGARSPRHSLCGPTPSCRHRPPPTPKADGSGGDPGSA
jgi:hypothetical protein